jgi:hypothetical protein
MKVGDKVMTCEGFTGTITGLAPWYKYEVVWDTPRQVHVGVRVIGSIYYESELRPVESEPTSPVETDWRVDYYKNKE